MMLILKLPLLYFGVVIYTAIKAGPEPPRDSVNGQVDALPSPWKPWQSTTYNRRRPRPSDGGPERRAPRGGSRVPTTRTHAK
jgi:hypothetical protein